MDFLFIKSLDDIADLTPYLNRLLKDIALKEFAIFFVFIFTRKKNHALRGHVLCYQKMLFTCLPV